MRVVFRVDSSKNIGSGHLVRCLSIAELLTKKGVETLFICRMQNGNFNYLIKKKNIPLKIIKSNYKNKKGIGPNNLIESEFKDANETIRLIKNQKLDLIIIDHYSLGMQWERALRPYTKKIFVIDDLANRKHDCDFLLDQNYVIKNHDRYANIVPKKCILFLGPQYALLQKDYEAHRKRIRTKVNRLLIFFGGHDNYSLSLRTLKCILKMKLSNVSIDIVISLKDESLNDMKIISKGYSNIFFHHGLASLANLIYKSDLAIGTGGISLWERCILGLPAIVTTVSENQIESSKSLSEVGAIKLLGHVDDFSNENFISVLKKLIEDEKELSLMSKNAIKVMQDWSYSSISKKILYEFR